MATGCRRLQKGSLRESRRPMIFPFFLFSLLFLLYLIHFQLAASEGWIFFLLLRSAAAAARVRV
jgi:hypothetical protein